MTVLSTYSQRLRKKRRRAPRFGALGLKVHLHTLVLGGVFAKDGAGCVQPMRRLTSEDVAIAAAQTA